MKETNIGRKMSCALFIVHCLLGKGTIFRKRGCKIGWAMEKNQKREKVDLGYCTKDWMSSGLCGYTTSRA